MGDWTKCGSKRTAAASRGNSESGSVGGSEWGDLPTREDGTHPFHQDTPTVAEQLRRPLYSVCNAFQFQHSCANFEDFCQ